MNEKMMIYDFRPLRLTLERIGPFQEQPYEIDFTDKELRPCNIFLLVSKNGFGKTTILETMAALVGLLEYEQPLEYGQEDLDRGLGRAQLDLFLRVYREGRDQTIVLSIIAGAVGEEMSLKIWDDESLTEYGAESWHRVSFRSRVPGHISKGRTNSELGDDLLATIHFNLRRVPDNFGESAEPLPTLLYFSAYRDIPAIQLSRPANGSLENRSISQPKHWGYRPVHRFSPHDQEWLGSLDNLLVWLKWLSDGRFEKARDLINKRVFRGKEKFLKDVQRDPPEAIIQCGEQSHRLDRLSSGEKSLCHLFLRIGAHMTRNTIVLIDELEAHLHIRWQHALFKALKELVAENDGITVIATTHSSELLHTFANSLEIKEEGIIKGGNLIEIGMQ